MEKRRRPGIHSRFVVLAFLCGLPGACVAQFFILRSAFSDSSKVVLTLLVVLPWLALVLVIRARSRYHLRTVTNLLAALREGDFSFRARDVSRDDPYGEVITELNHLAENLRRQRVDDLEATALVRKVMAEIDVAVFAFDGSHRLRQVNAAGEKIFQNNGPFFGEIVFQRQAYIMAAATKLRFSQIVILGDFHAIFAMKIVLH